MRSVAPFAHLRNQGRRQLVANSPDRSCPRSPALRIGDLWRCGCGDRYKILRPPAPELACRGEALIFRGSVRKAYSSPLVMPSTSGSAVIADCAGGNPASAVCAQLANVLSARSQGSPRRLLASSQTHCRPSPTLSRHSGRSCRSSPQCRGKSSRSSHLPAECKRLKRWRGDTRNNRADHWPRLACQERVTRLSPGVALSVDGGAGASTSAG